jgi:hypothetical protein
VPDRQSQEIEVCRSNDNSNSGKQHRLIAADRYPTSQLRQTKPQPEKVNVANRPNSHVNSQSADVQRDGGANGRIEAVPLNLSVLNGKDDSERTNDGSTTIRDDDPKRNAVAFCENTRTQLEQEDRVDSFRASQLRHLPTLQGVALNHPGFPQATTTVFETSILHEKGGGQ